MVWTSSSALSDAAAIPTHAVVKHFRDELLRHVEMGACPLSAPVAAEARA